MSHRVNSNRGSQRVSHVSPRISTTSPTPNSTRRMLSSCSSQHEYQLISNRDTSRGSDFNRVGTFQFRDVRTGQFDTMALEQAIQGHPEESEWREALKILVKSVPFQAAMALAIIANAVVIGLETDCPDYPYWSIFENAFLILFSFELGARIIGEGCRSFFLLSKDEILWNVFDAIIVSLGAVDSMSGMIVSSEHKQGQGGVSTLFRMVRLLRILRIFKIIRFLKHLYMLSYGFIEAAQSVFWVTILMSFVLYVCSIVLVRMVGHLPETDEHHEFLKDHYGTIVKSMLSLFDLMSQPDMHPYHGMRSSYPLLTMFLICWIIFGSFGMIALLTGVISESMFEKNALRIEAEHLEREQKRNALNTKLGAVFEQIIATSNDFDGKGEVTVDQVMEVLPQVGKIFEENMIAYSEHDMLHVANIMDADESGSISKEEFVHGLVSIAEDIRPMSIAELFHSVQLVKARIAKCHNRLDNLEDKLVDLNKTDKFMKLELGIFEVGEAQEKISTESSSTLEIVQSLAAAQKHTDSSNPGSQDSQRNHLLNLELKINEVAEAQVKAAADSRLQLDLLQRLAAGLSQQQVLGVPAVHHNDSSLAAKLSACEAGILETRDIVFELQNQMKNAVTNKPVKTEFCHSAGTASSWEGGFAENLVKAAASEVDSQVMQERASKELDERIRTTARTN